TTSYLFDSGLGQVTATLDPNGHLSCWQYDHFARLGSRSEASAKATAVTGSCDRTLASFSFVGIGSARGQYLEAITNDDAGTAIQKSRSYFDGLGRTYDDQSSQRSSGGKIDSDYIYKAKAWDDRGQQTCETLPTRKGSTYTEDCDGSASPPHRTTTYDT